MKCNHAAFNMCVCVYVVSVRGSVDYREKERDRYSWYFSSEEST